MPNKKAAIKSVRQNEKRRLRNRALRSKLSRSLRQAEEAISGSGAAGQAELAVQTALSVIARTNSKGIIHRNKAARQAARLMKKYNALRASGAGAKSPSNPDAADNAT